MEENAWKKYKRTGLSEMRPYVPNEDMSDISVSQTDTPELGGMIARNPDDHDDQWYVAKKYFEDNLEKITEVDLSEVKELDYTVFPSEEKCIEVVSDEDYGGAHLYIVRNSIGFKNGKAGYVMTKQFIQFVQKNADGTMIPGIQSEQLAYVLLDRAIKLNKRFPSDFNGRMIVGLNMFLDACKDRVKDRMDRGVMGDLKK